MAEYFEREKVIDGLDNIDWYHVNDKGQLLPGGKSDIETYVPFKAVEEMLKSIPAADVIDEENVLKFYYVRSTDDYWIGQRVDNFYYAEFDPEAFRWTWTHSRYLPWGEHVFSPNSLWKEHTYPSKPEEMPFGEWLRGLIKKYFPAADVRPR